MKKLILLLLITAFGYAQETKFTFTKEGFTDYVVTEVPGTQNEIYSKAINWIKENYKNPEEVIKMTIENQKVRIQGYKENFYCVKYGKQDICTNAVYVIEISFKDGKYKFEPIEMKLSNSAGSYQMDLNNTSVYYNKKGELLKGSEKTPELLENLFNDLNGSLKDYINGVKKNEW